jgi:hypothetical protein
MVGEKGEAAPADFNGGGGFVELLAGGVQPLYPDRDGRFDTALKSSIVVGGCH